MSNTFALKGEASEGRCGLRAAAPGIALQNLGCRVNRVEIDTIASTLEDAGCKICPAEDARVVVINTCAVTGEAETKTRKALRRATRLPQRPAVIATGCVAALLKEKLCEQVPGILVEPDKRKVADLCLAILGKDGTPLDQAAQKVGDRGAFPASPTPTGRTRPGIKIQDGCDNRCSFCIVWKARGPSRSRAADEVVQAVKKATERGAHEVVLTGINLGNYRAPMPRTRDGLGRLEDLLTHLLETTSIERIRLSSIEPPDVTDRLLAVMAESDGRVAPFLHVCLQSGSDATLRRMRRVYDTAFFADMVARARAAVEDIALETDLIVGFPQESDEEFGESYDFCQDMRFAKMHVFRYSKRPGTPAAAMEGQVPPSLMAERAKRMLSLADTMRAEEVAREVGKEEKVIVQYPGKAVTARLFDAVVEETLPVGTFASVRFARSCGGVLYTV